MLLKIVISLIFLTFLINLTNAGNNIVCYYATWATYRHGNGKYNVEHIDPHLCTHVMYTFFGITDYGEIRIIDPYLDLEDNWGRGNIRQFNSLKQQNPQLKTFAAVGGWNEGSHNFSIVANDPLKRKRFAQSASNFLRIHNFDGLDLDWEYPGQRGGDEINDKQAYILLLQELRQEFNKYGLLLSAAVAGAEFSAKISYNIPEVVKNLDIINVMTYDLHGAWDTTIGINSPLYSRPNETTITEQQLNVNACISYWLSQGAPREKLTVGIPFYGRTFTLQNANDNKPGALHTGPGTPGQYTSEPGFMGYNEYCEKQLYAKWTESWEDDQSVPYAYSGNQWIGYDNARSLEIKANFIKSLNLGGAMIWSIDMDDVHGVCQNGFYPMLNLLKRLLNNNSVTDSTTWEPTSTITPEDLTSTTPEATTVTPSTSTESTTRTTPTWSTTTENSNNICPNDGIFPNLDNCAEFIICRDNEAIYFKCPSGLLFDKTINTCNWASEVDCD